MDELMVDVQKDIGNINLSDGDDDGSVSAEVSPAGRKLLTISDDVKPKVLLPNHSNPTPYFAEGEASGRDSI